MGGHMNKIHQIEKIEFDGDMLVLTVDGKTVRRDLKTVSSKLASLPVESREQFEVSPSGYGIHWPVCDEDLSVDALLGIEHQAPMIAAEDGVEYKTR